MARRFRNERYEIEKQNDFKKTVRENESKRESVCVCVFAREGEREGARAHERANAYKAIRESEETVRGARAETEKGLKIKKNR